MSTLANFFVYHWNAASVARAVIRQPKVTPATTVDPKEQTSQPIGNKNTNGGECKTDSGWSECICLDSDWSKSEEINRGVRKVKIRKRL